MSPGNCLILLAGSRRSDGNNLILKYFAGGIWIEKSFQKSFQLVVAEGAVRLWRVLTDSGSGGHLRGGFFDVLEGHVDDEASTVDLGSSGAGQAAAQADQSLFQGGEELGEFHFDECVRVDFYLTIEDVILATTPGAVRGTEFLAFCGDAAALFSGIEDVAAFGDHGFSPQKEKAALWAVFWVLLYLYFSGLRSNSRQVCWRCFSAKHAFDPVGCQPRETAGPPFGLAQGRLSASLRMT
jgi:hypothetical protein